MGTVRDISWKEGQDPTRNLLEALINISSLPITQFCQYVAPIFPATTRFECNSVNCSRIQFPLIIAYAITVHKVQGLTLSRIVLNITGKDFALGLCYVAISRVKTFDGLLFDEPLSLHR